MKLILNNVRDAYECENLVRIFFPGVDLKTEDGDFVSLSRNGELLTAEISVGGRKTRKTEKFSENDEWGEAGLLFSALSLLTGHTPQWGMLTGVRPVKLVLDMMKDGRTDEEIIERFQNKYKVSAEKTALALKTAKSEERILSSADKKSISIYAGIPFCPTRCKYCSFVCEGIEHCRDLVPKYTELLCREIETSAEMVDRLGLKVKTVYVGGGTPTSLQEEELYKVVNTLKIVFKADKAAEFTVEAGRPDTITAEKLAVLKECSVGRISINPQTLNNEVLKHIGRDHTAEQFYESFDLADKMNCFDINVDLIAGLPNDSEESFRCTVNEIVRLSPANITLHTLTLKRSAGMYNSKELYETAEAVKKRIAYGNSLFERNGYSPYYLYRQKNTIGGLENTGFTKQGKEGLYNVFIMDEAHSILACGAGASSKAVCGRSKIVRSFNYKYPREYISGFSDILERKKNFEKELISSLQEE